MSSFILPTHGFVMLATEFATYAEDSKKEVDTKYLIASRIRKYLGYHESAFDSPADAHPRAALRVQELHTANVAAFNGRYVENEAIPTETPINISFPRLNYWPQWEPIQFYKYLTCLRYQLAEDPVYESPIYQQLDQLCK